MRRRYTGLRYMLRLAMDNLVTATTLEEVKQANTRRAHLVAIDLLPDREWLLDHLDYVAAWYHADGEDEHRDGAMRLRIQLLAGSDFKVNLTDSGGYYRVMIGESRYDVPTDEEIEELDRQADEAAEDE